MIEKLATLDSEAAATLLPPDGDTVKRLTARLDDLRKLALESMRMALQVNVVLFIAVLL